MAATAHQIEADKVEHFDPPEVLARKLDQLAQWVREASHGVFFTGAGISTGAGIPDFRSGMSTRLKTGPGAWELRANKARRKSSARTVSTLSAIPTPTHMLIRELLQSGEMRFLISQNTDGLHRRSGVPVEQLAELHGNSNLEVCRSCGKQYLRDFKVRRKQHVHKHNTGRTCAVAGCEGNLRDTIINFGENLPERDIDLGFAHAGEADLCIAMGSSLRVTPAADMPEEVATRGGRLVVVNLQPTPLDGAAALKINAMCDDVSRGLAERLGVAIPAFRLTRFVRAGTAARRGAVNAVARGEDADGTSHSFIKSGEVRVGRRGEWKPLIDNGRARLPRDIADGTPVTLRLAFAGHYREPPVEIEHTYRALRADNDRRLWRISFDPRDPAGGWSVDAAVGVPGPVVVEVD